MRLKELIEKQAERYGLPTTRGPKSREAQEEYVTEFERVMKSPESLALIESLLRESFDVGEIQGGDDFDSVDQRTTFESWFSELTKGLE